MDIKIALVDLSTMISDNRDEVLYIIKDYLSLRSFLSKRKNDDNLVSILDCLDERYKEILEELDNEYSILWNVANYLTNYIGYSEETGEYLYNYAQELIETAESRVMYETFLYKWYLDIANSPLKNTKEFDFPKYEEQISRSDVVKVMLLQKI